jgi:DNA polymerase-3 subunit beta
LYTVYPHVDRLSLLIEKRLIHNSTGPITIITIIYLKNNYLELEGGSFFMKFIIQRDLLVDRVQDVLKAISSRTTIPILTGIKINVTEDGVTLTGSDSDISIESFIPIEENDKQNVEVEKTGSIVLQARFFGEIVRKLPGDSVELEVLDHFNTKITSGTAEFNLNGQDADEYPHLPQIDDDSSFSIPTDLLKEMIRQTVFAVSTQETRPILTGVNWKVENQELICTATDSHRLALRRAPIETIDTGLTISNIVIPGKSLNELNKILDDTNEPISIVITENQILFKSNHLLFFSRLLDGNYPDTSRLIPNENKTEIVVSSKDFLHSIDRASLLAKEGRNNVVKLATLDNNVIQVSSNIPEVGKVIEQIQGKFVIGEELKISFSAKYMMDALKAIDSTEIKISFTGAMRPFLIRTLHDESILQLILPVRTY